MVEPFAAVIFNSLLSGRSTLRHHPSLNSAARVMAGQPRQHANSDFFTPRPRRVKGKQKAVDSLNLPCHLLQCQEWSSCAEQHSLWCPHQSRFLMLEEINPLDDRLVPRHTSQRPSQRTHPRSSHYNSLTSGLYGGQRRHASHVSEPVLKHAPQLVDSVGISSLPHMLMASTSEVIHRFESALHCEEGKFQLDAAWDAYTLVLEHDAVSSFSPEDLLVFADKLIITVENRHQTITNLGVLPIWGHRVKGILVRLESQVEPLSASDLWRRCLLARSLALIGDLQQAVSLVHAADKIPLVYEEKAGILRAYEAIIMSTLRQHGGIHMLEFILLEWASIGSHLTKKRGKWHHSAPAISGRSLRETVFAAVSELDNPETALANRPDWDDDQRQHLGNFVMEVYCDQKLPAKALDVLHEMKRQKLSIPVGLQLSLVRALAREDMFEPANTLYVSLPANSTFKYHMSTGLYLYAHQGDNIRAEEYYHILTDHNWASEYDTAMLLYAYATQGRTEQVFTLFNDFFPEEPDGKRLNSPSLLHFSIAIYAYAQKGDITAINRWLESMSKAGLAPDIYVFTMILRGFALRGDLESITAVLAQMRENRIQPNAVSYTTLITLLAHRKDPVGAETIYKRAIKEGIVPDRRMITSVMNAHVEAGSWKGVIRAFDYLKNSRSGRIRLTIEVYNTLLKAYVLIGAPFHVVSKLFTKLEQSNIQPDAYTFALLVQSACDAGKMRLASDIFYEMDRRDELDKETRRTPDLINAYVLTIIMAGFLRLGDKIRAKAVYDDMRDRGIQPTSITFGTILKAYGNQKTEESLQIAEDFVKSIADVPVEDQVWDTPTHGRKSALDHIYGPVIQAYAQQQKAEDVERLFQDILDKGATPSLGILTTLLDAYRRTFNIDAVLQIWPQIFELGLRYSGEKALFGDDENDPTQCRLQANILCIPLSIYIDALSAAGLHLEIAATWKKFQTHSFSFDSHNWNHLVVALVRAGEPERAFEVVEKVILPYQWQSERLRKTRDPQPDTPLLFDSSASESSIYDDDTDVPSEPPMHSATRRAKAVSMATTNLPNLGVDEEGHDQGFAHPLHILHQISPSWTVWRPHTASLSILLMVLSRLESGTLIKAITTGEAGEIPIDDSKPLMAREMLNRIYKNYPNTIGVVLNYEGKEKRRLERNYDQTYNWR